MRVLKSNSACYYSIVFCLFTFFFIIFSKYLLLLYSKLLTKHYTAFGTQYRSYEYYPTCPSETWRWFCWNRIIVTDYCQILISPLMFSPRFPPRKLESVFKNNILEKRLYFLFYRTRTGYVHVFSVLQYWCRFFVFYVASKILINKI